MTTPHAPSPFASLKINHAAIRVPDFDTAVAWYADKLDFRLKQSVSFAGLNFGFLYPTADDSFHFELLAGTGAADDSLIKICTTATRCLAGTTRVFVSITSTIQSTN